MRLESYIDNLIANDLDCNHWFMTKQTMSDYYFPFFIASIVESYPIKRTAEQNYGRYYSYAFKNNEETKRLYPTQWESENTYRNSIVAEFLGLIRNDDRRYATAKATPAYQVLKKYIKKHDDVGTYKELVDHQIEKICLNVVPSNKFDEVRSVTLFPVVFLYKILMELQKKYNNSRLDYKEFSVFVMRSRNYDDWSMVLDLIEQYRNKSYDRKYDEKIEQILEHESTKNVRFNALFGSLSHLDYVSWESYKIKSDETSRRYVEKIVNMYEKSEIYHEIEKNKLHEFMCSDNFFEGKLDTVNINVTSLPWVAFYEEFATKLLAFKDDRDALIKCIKDVYSNIDIKLPTLEKDNDIVDIDPFTVFALFNKGITTGNRIKIITGFKEQLGIVADVPDNFDGIPLVNNLSATFYYFKDSRQPNDIQNLWDLFETAITYADNKSETIKSDFINHYDLVVAQKGISWNVTMGLFWARPKSYINLDSCMRTAFKNNSLIPPVDETISPLIKKLPSGAQYLTIIEECLKVFDTHPDLSFAKLSVKAWENSLDRDEKGYWPSLNAFNPAITVEMWTQVLEEPQVTSLENLAMLKMMMELGGESTCAKLAEKYGKSPYYYNALGSGYGSKLSNYFHIEPIVDNGEVRYFVFPFQGKAVKEEGKGRYMWRIRPELKEALEQMDLSYIDLTFMEKNGATNIPKNTILYGPPGTGKTYHTVCYAVSAVENKPLETVIAEEYQTVFDRYNTYKNEGLIEFVTFHQSYGYEEFIEGIKPITETNDDEENSDIKYANADGVFKAFCEKAVAPIIKNNDDILGINKNPAIWKVSLEGTGNNPTRNECMENGHIRIGFDEYGEKITDDTTFSVGGKKVLSAFINRMKVGDIIFSCFSATTIDAIGVVAGEYEWHDEYEHYKRVRKVNWIAKGLNVDIVDMNNGANMTLSSVYRLKNITFADAMTIIKNNVPIEISSEEKKNHVFIIDEINRGNISKIFGELITLIEPSKRVGADEEIKAVLPYSKKPFGIPENVYILGTMNTADRSIATLDTALRRRFDFVEMMPDAEVLEGIEVDGINISAMLRKMNERIAVLFDREHTIGHAYFIGLKDNLNMEKLASIFKNKVIPLLQEYFYEDYERIRLVLADNQVSENEKQFIIAETVDATALFGNSEIDIVDETKRYMINDNAFKNADAYIKIYSI